MFLGFIFFFFSLTCFESQRCCECLGGTFFPFSPLPCVRCISEVTLLLELLTAIHLSAPEFAEYPSFVSGFWKPRAGSCRASHARRQNHELLRSSVPGEEIGCSSEGAVQHLVLQMATPDMQLHVKLEKK